MEPENEPLEEEIPMKNHHFQVPCWFSGVYLKPPASIVLNDQKIQIDLSKSETAAAHSIQQETVGR